MLGITEYFYRLIPANPILLRVVETGGKRRRDLIIRCAYLGLLIAFVLVSLAGADVAGSLNDLAKTSTGVFRSLSYLQLTLVALLAPIFTAGAITQEKDSQTYDILLSTPLNNGQIVLGSLLSRLFFIIILLISGIPVFSITQIFGGVLIHNILISFLIAASTAFVTGSLAMAIATFKVGTRRTIFSFYLFIVMYLVGLWILDQFQWSKPIIGMETDTNGTPLIDPLTHGNIPIYATTGWLTGLHPFLALRTLFAEKAYTPPLLVNLPPDLQRWPFGWYLTSPASFYVTFMFTLSFVLVIPSIIMLRWLAQTNLPLKTWILTKVHLSKGDRTRKPRTVWSNPIAWREAKTKGSAVRASWVRYGFIGLGVIGSIILVWQYGEMVEPEQKITPSSYDATQGKLTIYNKTQEPHIYNMPPTAKIRLKNDLADTETPREGHTTDLKNIYAATVEASSDNSIAVLTLAPIPHKVSEQTVRNYLLGSIVFEFAVILLIVTNAAASTVTREKEDGTLDLLLTTPITSRYYIWGKLRGLVWFVLPLVAVPVASVCVFVLYDIFRFTGGTSTERWIAFPESIILLPITMIIVAAFAGILGMQMSLRCRTTVMAVMASVGIVVGICGVLGLLGYKFLDMRDSGVPSLIIGSFSPFTVMSMMVNPYDFAAAAFGSPDDMAGNRVAIFIGSLVSVGAYTALVWYMYTSMVKNFDMTIRRQQR